MREIKFLGTIHKPNTTRSYQYSLFECQECKKLVEKVRKDGLKASYCSHECYSKNRNKRGPYREFVDISGYKYIYNPDHPNSTNHGYVAEHRLVMESIIGRYLNYDEDIHHIDFNKYNNNPDNLILLTKRQHSKLHYYFKKQYGGGIHAKAV